MRAMESLKHTKNIYENMNNYKPISYLELKEIIEQQKLSILDGEKVSR